MRLSDLVLGESGIVKKIGTKARVKERLECIGLTKGVKMSVIRFAPFLDPIEIKLRDFCLAIRKEDADLIEVEKVE